MSWRGQVQRVVEKDVRRYWWLLGAYLVLVVARTVAAMRLWREETIATDLSGWGLLLLAAVVVAVLAQHDAPARPTAFWRTLPVAPSAIVAAKALIFGIVIVTPTLIGEGIALSRLTADTSVLTTVVGRGTGFLAFAVAYCWLVATVTGDLRTFLVVLVGLPVLLLSAIALSAYGGYSFAMAAEAGGVAADRTWALALAVVGCIAWVYFTREARWWHRVVSGTVLVPSLFVLPLLALPFPNDVHAPPHVSEAPTTVRVLRVREEVGRATPGFTGLSVALALSGVGTGVASRLERPQFELQFPDGSIAPGSIGGGSASLGATDITLGDTLTIAGLRRPLSELTSSVFFRLSRDQQASLTAGRARLILTGDVTRLRAVARATQPLTSVVRYDLPRMQVQLGTSDRTASNETVALKQRTIGFLSTDVAGGPQFFAGPDGRQFSVVAVPPNAKVAVVLTLLRGSSGTHSLVLPSPNVFASDFDLGITGPAREIVSGVSDWFRSATLVLVEWQPVARATVSDTFAIRTLSPRPETVAP